MDNLSKFTKEFSGRFGNVHESNKAYEETMTVGEIPDIPSFKVVYDPEPQPQRLVYHQFLETDVFDTEDEANTAIINKIEKFAKSVIPQNHNFKHYILFWRFKPEIVHEKDFDLMKDLYKGWARLSIISEG